MRVYVVKQNSTFVDWGKRVGSLHDAVFYGVGDYRTLLEWNSHPGINEKGERCAVVRPPDWRWPAVTNDNRELVHLSRSGRFVPAVFGPSSTTLVVSPKVREALSSLPNVGFNDVVFEHLVDLPMPKLGDFSWYERGDIEEFDFLPNNLLLSLPHVPEFEQSVGPYYQVLPANFDDLASPRPRWRKEGEFYRFLPPDPDEPPSKYADIESVPVDFGSYAYVTSVDEVRVSRQMLREYPIVQEPAVSFLFREDAFAKIAPFLDLDFYAIAVLTLE